MTTKTQLKESFQQLYKHIEPFGVPFNAVAAAMLLGILFLIIHALMLVGDSGSLTRFLAAKNTTLSAVERTKPNPPSALRAAFLDTEVQKLNEMGLQLKTKDFFWKKLRYSEKERLEFKELLFDVRQELDKMAESEHVLFNEKAFLPDFAQSLPGKEELPQLFMALKLSEELRRIIIQSGIARVEEMNFPEAQSTDYGKELRRHVFTVHFKTMTSWEAWLTMMEKLASSNYLWRIENVSIENKIAEPKSKELAADETLLSSPLLAEVSLTGTFYSEMLPTQKEEAAAA